MSMTALMTSNPAKNQRTLRRSSREKGDIHLERYGPKGQLPGHLTPKLQVWTMRAVKWAIPDRPRPPPFRC